jgi:gluconolactonase
MKTLVPAFAALTIALSAAEPDYPLSEDSKPQEGVPRGEVLTFEFAQSKIFPGTTREVKVYVPRQYDGTTPACLYVNQDGLQWKTDVVFDNLIAKKEMPVTIGVFVMHGRVKALDGTAALDRFNRSYEYDGLGDAYARFLISELLPEVERRKTSDGREIKLSKKATDRAIGGSSSGAVCAWTAAWERPDSFSRVFSTIGTYVGLRGANIYPTLVRKFEPKPLRVFLQDGSNDLNIYAGDWWMVNQEMERALTWAGYEVSHAWGEGGHNGKHGTALFPDAMRWLWKDWPVEPKNSGSKNPYLRDILLPGEDWQLVGEGYQFTEGPAANAKGEVFFNDVGAAKTYQVTPEGKAVEWLAQSQGGDGQAFGPDGKLYAAAGKANAILGWSDGKQSTQRATGFRGNDLVVHSNGNMYVTEPGWDGKSPSKIWLIKPDGTSSVVDTGLKFSNGITLSPDQSLLYVDDSRSHWVYSFQVQPDGTLASKQRYYWLHQPDQVDDSGADGLEVDRDGRLYVATRVGIQVCDQAGRVNCILPTPNGKVSNLCFGGEKFDTLYATCGDKVYKRKMKSIGAPNFLPPVKPKPPGL